MFLCSEEKNDEMHKTARDRLTQSDVRVRATTHAWVERRTRKLFAYKMQFFVVACLKQRSTIVFSALVLLRVTVLESMNSID